MRNSDRIGSPLAASLAGVIFAGCAATRPAMTPALIPAPAPVVGLALEVDPNAAVGGYWSRHKLGRELVRALGVQIEAALIRAGYHLTHRDPDLVLTVSAELAGSTESLVSATTLELLKEGRSIDRFEVRSPEPSAVLAAELYPAHVATRLVNALSRSAALATFAALPRPQRIEPPDQLSLERGSVLAAFDVLDASGELDPRAQDQVSDYLHARLTQALGYRVVPRARVKERILAEKEHSYQACVDQSCQIELGKALAAQTILVTKLLRMGGTCALTATLFDLKTETAERATTVKTKCGTEGLIQGVDDLVGALLRETERPALVTGGRPRARGE